MDEEAGFVAAILADPADDLAGLAFADWLDDRGDPRAEYFRLRHLLHTLEPDNRAGTRRKHQLRRRILNLLARHWAGLRGCLPTRGILLESGWNWRQIRLEGAFPAVVQYSGLWDGLAIDGQTVPHCGGVESDVLASLFRLQRDGRTVELRVIVHNGWGFRVLGLALYLDNEPVYAEGEFPEN